MGLPHVLLVDDSALVRDALRLLFEETGHRISAAGTVAEAIAACESTPPDIVLLDLTLPDGDGLTMLPPLRARGALPPVVVALTGHDDEATVRRCEEAGCREVLLKPVPTRELLRKVAGWMAEVERAKSGNRESGTGKTAGSNVDGSRFTVDS